MNIRNITTPGKAGGKGFTLEHVVTEIAVEEYAEGYREIDRFLSLCKQCPRFGKQWTCPPCEFDVKAYVGQFKYAHILGSKMTFTADTLRTTTTQEGVKQVCDDAMKYALTKASAYLREYERLSPGSLCFLGSRCLLCGSQPCARQDAKPCRHPHDVRVSLEAVGFNLGKTTSQLLGIDLKWGGKDRLPEYITLVTALLTNDAALRLE